MSRRVLLVDDSPVMRAVLRRVFRIADMDFAEVLEAGNGREALDLLGRDAAVDLVVTDVNMPVMSGIELVAQLAAHETLRHIPVIIVSTERSERRRDDLRALGVRAILSKPFTPECLRDTVARVFQGETV